MSGNTATATTAVTDSADPENVSPDTTPDTSEASFFNQTYYLFLILFLLHFFFSVYLFFKVKNLEKKVGTGGVAAVQQPSAPAVPGAPSTELSITKPSTNEPWRGPQNARYVLVEYSDLECPFCKSIHPDLKKVQSENDTVAWVFRHYPLSFHPKAQKLGEAAECAEKIAGSGGIFGLGGDSENGFWKMTDAIYERMPDLELSSLPGLAAELGIDQAAFQSCLDGNETAQLVKDDMTEGQKAGVSATPTTVIYDMQTGKTKTIEGALPYDSIKTTLDTFIAENQ
jgi:protein-disulfide isomerase